MKKSFFKRSLALAVAAALTVTSLPVNMVFAEEAVIEEVAEIAAEPVEVDVPDAVVDEPADTDVVLDDAAVEDVAEPAAEAAEPSEDLELDAELTIDSIEPVDEVTGDGTTEPTNPTISNLAVNGTVVSWTAPADYENPYYFVRITDSVGRTYSSLSYEDYYSTEYNPAEDFVIRGSRDTSIDMSDYYSWGYFHNSDGSNAMDPEAGYLRFKPGQTYTVSVRVGYDGTEVSVPYTVGALTVPQQVTGVDLTGDMLTWAADTSGIARGYQISVLQNMGAGYYDYRVNLGHLSVSVGSNKYDLSDVDVSLTAHMRNADGSIIAAPAVSGDGKTVTAFRKDQTYLISVRAYNMADNGLIVYGPWSEAKEYKPTLTTPDGIVDVQEKDGWLSWSPVEDAEYYELSITDSRGTYHTGTGKDEMGVPNQYPITSEAGYNVRNVNVGAYIYNIQPDGSYKMLRKQNPDGTEGDPVRPFEANVPYTIQIRAVRALSGGEKEYGAWSSAFPYTLVERAVPEKVGAIQFVARESGGGYLKWNDVATDKAPVQGYYIEIKDPAGYEYFNGSEKNYWDASSGWILPEEILQGYTYDAATAKYTIAQDVKAFKKGQTYTVRIGAYNYKYGEGAPSGTPQVTWSDPYSFLYPASAMAKISDVWVKENGNLTWKADPVAQDYEITVKDASGRIYYTDTTTNPTTKVTEGVPLKSGGVSSVNLKDADLKTYAVVDGEWRLIRDAETGEIVKPFEEGQTYYISVQGITTSNGQTVKSEPSNEVVYTVPVTDSTSSGLDEDPPVVTGVKLKTTTTGKKDDGPISGVVLQWNQIPNVSKYEIRVRDAAGNEYFTNCYVGYDPVEAAQGIATKQKVIYKYIEVENSDYPQYILSSTALKAYVKNAGMGIETVKDANGKELKAFTEGQTYYIDVRAVNEYREDGKLKSIRKIEQWSEAVTYTVNVSAAITDLAWDPNATDEDNYYFTFSTTQGHANLYYQIATDASFSTASLVDGSDWKLYEAPIAEESTPESTPKLAISKNMSGLYPGATYYIRVFKGMEEPTEAEAAALVPVAFTTEARAPKNITGFKLYKTNKNDYEFRFDAVLDTKNGDHFVLQYTDKAQPAETDWVDGNVDNNKLSMDLLKEGTVYVRAIAYIEQRNPAKAELDKVYGAPSEIIAIPYTKETTQITDLKLAEKSSRGYVFQYTGTPRKNEAVEVWYSESADFTSDKTVTKKIVDAESEGNTGTFIIRYEELTPGTVYYVRARVRNTAANTTLKKYSEFTAAVKLTAQMPKINVSGAVIASKSITLKMDTPEDSDEYLTGYEIQLKSGKKYMTLAKTTDSVYKHTGLTADTTYTYRVRPYYYNTETGKTKNGSWVYYEATTWGGALNLKAKAASKTSVKLTWNKVSGAEGYEVYRYVGSSLADEVKAGDYNNFVKYAFLKDVAQAKKGKTVKYTDKKLKKDLSYSYMVRAYKTVDGEKFYVSASAGVDLSFNTFALIGSPVQSTNGKVKVNWSRVYAAKGYLVEKYDTENEKWVTVKKLGATKTAYTFPATSDNKGVQYRIRAYKGTNYSNAVSVVVNPFLAAPTGVKAKVNKAEGSVTVTWNPVKGADYYRVYRTSSSWKVKNATTKAFTYQNGSVVPVYEENASTISGYKEVTDEREMTATTLVDRPITYTVDGATNTVYSGPVPGVQYYYYVVAYKFNEAYNYVDKNDDTTYRYYETLTDSEDEDPQGVIATVNSNLTVRSGASKTAKALITSVKVSKPKIKSVKASSGKVTLKWNKIKKAEGYEIYRSTSKKKGYELIGTAKGSAKKYVDKTAEKGKKYYYKIRAYKLNEAGVNTYSKDSKVKNVTAK